MLTRSELLSLLQDVFSVVPANGGPKLLDELKTLLANRGTLEMTVSGVWDAVVWRAGAGGALFGAGVSE